MLAPTQCPSRQKCIDLAIVLQFFTGAFILENRVSHNLFAEASDRFTMQWYKCSKHGEAKINKNRLGVLASFARCFILASFPPESVTNTTVVEIDTPSG